MNVTQSEKRPLKSFTKTKNELIRKDVTIGIRGSLLLPVNPYKTINNVRKSNKKAEPRYKFEQQFSTSKRPMGPPSGPPPNLKRRINYTSSSTKPDSSLSCQTQPRILASDSAAADTDFSTPKSRPSALRYISSSSRGGHSGTRSARSTSTSVVDASVILAISEGRGMARGEIGMAAVDLRHPHLVLCQFSDTLLYTHTLTKINYFNPIEIVVPHTFCEGVQPNQLYKLIKDQFPLVNVTAVQRRHFNDAAGRQNIQTLCAPQYNTVYLQVIHKFYALTAAAAVLKYVEYIQCIVFARESLKIEYHSSENTMIIDVGTATQLELVQPLVPSAGPTCCLLGVLGPTYTVGGIRALRAAILQPSCNKEFIEARLDAVQELIDNDTGLMVDIQDVIKKLSEIDKILFLCIETTNQNIDKYGEAQLNQTLLLKTTMEMVPKLVEALQPVISDRLRNIKLDFENPHYKKITDCIRTVIQEDAHLEKGAMGSMQRCFAVKPEINGLLDVARRTYSELIEDIQKIVEQLGETYDLPLRLNQNVMKGFHIVLPVAPRNRRHFNIEELPSIFIQVIFNGASVTMTTEELVVLDQQAKESLKEIQKMSNIVIWTLLKELRPFMSSLYKLCENVAELDILLALAQTSTVGSYIRPDFDSYLDIRNSVHPLLDYNTHVMPVPNDIFASPEHNFTIITGPNMGGKSIYIKQIAIMHIMAQLGCFLPATNAVLRVCDRIFSRIGFNDSIEFNASFFVIEMKEAQHILKGLTSSSLVIMDELCRLVEFGNSFNEESIQSYILLIQSNFSGTNIEEGASLAWSICEELIMSEAFTFFTTHFMHLSRLQDLYYNVINVHTAVKEEIDTSLISEKRLIYQHKIEPGITTIKNYGLTLAAMTNLPADVVSLAKELAELMDRSTEPYEIPSLEQTDEAVLYDLNAKIQQASRKNHKCEESLKNILKQFKNHYPQIMDRLKLERSINSNKDTTNTTIDQIHNSSIETTVSQELQKNKNNHSPKQSSTSIDSDSEMECLESNENIIASVKSSTQLLNIFINNTTNINPTTQKDIQDVTNNITEYKDEANGQNNNLILVKADIRHNNNFVKFNDIGKIANNTIRDDDENIINVISNVDSSNDSDIAEDLTQVLEDCSEDDSGNSSKMSLDEGLMKETLDEINRDLNTMLNESIEDIVLTPPLEFRDSTNVYDNIIQK